MKRKILMEFYPKDNSGKITMTDKKGNSQEINVINSNFESFIHHAMPIIQSNLKNKIQ